MTGGSPGDRRLFARGPFAVSTSTHRFILAMTEGLSRPAINL